MNSTYHKAVKNTPYQALSGNKPRFGLSSKIPEDFIAKISPSINEEDLKESLKDSWLKTIWLYKIEVTDGLVVTAGISVTWNVLLGVMSSSPDQAELGVRGTSVKVILEPT